MFWKACPNKEHDMEKHEKMIKDVAAAVLVHEGKILIAQRPREDFLAGRWEFPGGAVEWGETPENCLKREFREELDIDTTIGDFMGTHLHHYPHGPVRLHVYLASWQGGQLNCSVHEACRWVTVQELHQFEFSQADQPFVERLQKEEIPFFYAEKKINISGNEKKLMG